MKILLWLSIFLITGTTLVAQTIVTGKVTDAETGAAMQGVNVVVVEKSLGTTTDWEGKFWLSIEEKLPVQIRFSMVGFVPVIVELDQKYQELNIKLKETETELNEIIISASRTPERIMESPVTIERMDVRDVQNTTSASFYDGLVNLKGVDVNTNSLTFQSINTRGFATFANTRFVQLVDGMDNASPALNFAIGNMLGMSELDVNTVELLPGAASALYGANAFNGIMFMESKNPFEHQGVSFYGKTGYTSQDAAGNNQFVDAGFRAARAFSEKFAAKLSVSFLNGTEWYANDYADYNNPGFTRNDPDYDGLNIYGDEVFTNMDASFGTPSGTIGTVSRTGYKEVDLIDYGAESLKADLSLNYRPNGDDLEIIFNSKFGRGNTIYQGTNRYSIQNFYMYQNKLEVRNNNFFVRGYMTGESAGDSYDTRFAAINVQRQAKSDIDWFTDYFLAYSGALLNPAFGGIFNPIVPTPGDHMAARAFADGNVLNNANLNPFQIGALNNGVAPLLGLSSWDRNDDARYVPGTPQFNKAFNEVISDPDLSKGAKFVDNTKIYHVDANYNFNEMIEFADIQIGGSWRQYSLNSSGSIFTDYDGPINYGEIGAYTQLQKKFVDDRLKFTGSIRYDKAKNFDGHISPRISLLYTVGEKRNHNFRVSYQTGFRNPTTQDLYIGLDAGRAILVGSAPDNLNRYTSVPLNISSQIGQSIVGGPTVQLSGARAYDNAFTLSSALSFGDAVKQAMAGGVPAELAAALNADKLIQSSVDYVKPEKVKAYEMGYRSNFSGITIDFSAYYNKYEDFIGNKTAIVPYYGNVSAYDPANVTTDQNTQLLLLAMGSEDYRPFQIYTNSKAEISSYGIGIGLSKEIFNNYNVGINYVWSKFDFDKASDPDYEAGFNTPEHVFKASFGSQHVVKDLGFNVNFRWNNEYYWESTFVDGTVPANSVIDAQVNYSLRKWKSVIKLGATNIGGNEYFSAPGTGYIGSKYYLSLTVKL